MANVGNLNFICDAKINGVTTGVNVGKRHLNIIGYRSKQVEVIESVASWWVMCAGWIVSDVIRIIGLKEGSGDVTGGYISVFMSKYSALDKNCFRSNCGGSSLLFGNVIKLFAAVSTSTSLYFTRSFFREEH